jgi:hypothetical protein
VSIERRHSITLDEITAFQFDCKKCGVTTRVFIARLPLGEQNYRIERQSKQLGSSSRFTLCDTLSTS